MRTIPLHKSSYYLFKFVSKVIFVNETHEGRLHFLLFSKVEKLSYITEDYIDTFGDILENNASLIYNT